MKQLFQFHKLGKQFLPVVVFSMALTASAQTDFQRPIVQSREVEIVQPYNEVEVIGDVTIILTNNLDRKVLFHGAPKEVQTAKATVKNRKLIIDAHQKRSRDKFTVYLPASIRLLITSGKTEVLSSGTIKTRDLEIFLNGSSFVSVRYDGKLNVVPGTGYEIVDPGK